MELGVFIKKILYLISSSRRKLVSSIALFFVLSVLDLISIGLMGPLFSILLEAEEQSKITAQMYSVLSWFGISSVNVSALIAFIAVLFCIKAYVAIAANRRVINFSLNMQFDLRRKLAEEFFNRSYLDVRTQNSANFVEITHRLVEQF